MSAHRPVPTAVCTIGLVIVAPVFGCAAWLSRRYWDARGVSVVTRTLARARAIVLCAVGVLLAMIVTALVLIAVVPDETVPPGQPEVVNGRYVLDEHGSLTPVPRSVYDQARLQQERIWTAAALLFGLAAVWTLGATGERMVDRRRRSR